MLTLFGALWNLFLLALPTGIIFFLEKQYAEKHWRAISLLQKLSFLLLFAFFILLFPNIPYIFVDARHILDHCSTTDFYRRCYEAPWSVPVFFTYALIALPFFLLTIRKSAALLAQLWHPVWKYLAPPIVLGLASLGVLMGLYERLNSWDALLAPPGVLAHALSYFATWQKFELWAIYTVCFGAIYYSLAPFFLAAKK